MSPPSIKLFALLLTSLQIILTSSDTTFSFTGFKSSNLTLDGLAEITTAGLLRLSNITKQKSGHAFFSTPLHFKNSSDGSLFSFSTHFVCAIVPDYQPLGGHGMAFVLAPTPGLPSSLPSTYLGLFNDSNNGNDTNHVLAVELDTLQSSEFNDIDDNHAGIDINGLFSVQAEPAAYYDDRHRTFRNFSLKNGEPMHVWIDFNNRASRLTVTLAPIHVVSKPSIPLLSLDRDLSSVINEIMYVGFSAAPLLTSHYVLSWSFAINGLAPPLDLSQLPELPRIGPKKVSKGLTVGLPVVLAVSVLMAVTGLVYYFRRKQKFAEVIEGWEVDYMPHRFRYKDLYIATKGFKEEGLLGTGGFGKVYKGRMPGSKLEVAVKKVSHESRQGMKEFVAEIVSIGRLRHRNLVPLLGYCRRKGELLLVYEYMPNGSLDRFLHYQPKSTLDWEQRLRIIKGVASGLLYLHEEWEQVVVHRDIKASNVLLDMEFEARLGDFGLARLYDHGSDPQTTHVVGTLGYLAPEHTRTRKATTSSDVYAFGAFLLEVTCGRRPVDHSVSPEKSVLVEWVFALWSNGEIGNAVDQKLGSGYNKEEVELILKLGLLCSHSRAEMRPRIREVVRYIDGTVALPELSAAGISANGLSFGYLEGFDDLKMSYTSSVQTALFSGSSSITNSLISSGR